MTDMQQVNRTDADNAAGPGLVQGLAIAATAVFILLAAPGGRGMEAWGPLLVLIVATPVFVLVRPVPLLRLLSGPTGAKVGAMLLLGAVVVMVGMFVATMFR
jgi:hypothetical protein